ncbi:MAG: phage tail sheath family protein [Methanothrix sp.]|nr:phage tail sheath family protein [Methanothrix sp.]
MPEYLTPGVYIEEIDIGPKPIEGVSTSTAGFVGPTDKGPLDPRLVTSFEQFQRIYGGFRKDSFMAYAVDGFFRNGGSRCYIARIIGKGAKEANLSLRRKEEAINVVAKGSGLWGNELSVMIEDGTLDPNLFKLSVANGKKPGEDEPQIVEVFDNISTDESSSNYYVKTVSGVSNFIVLSPKGKAEGAEEAGAKPKFVPLAGGDDGKALAATDFMGGSDGPGGRTGLESFNEFDDISIVCIPDESKFPDVLADALVTHCEKRKDRFAILQAEKSSTDIPKLRPPKASKYAAFYYPWIKILDPLTGLPILVPSGGHVAGVYARVDQEKGVHKAPANEVVNGALGLEFNITKGEQDVLNPRGVNCIRAFPGRGILIWGARTAASDPAWKYVNVRRLFIFVEKSIEVGTQWVVFEPNDEKLWARVKQTINQFLTSVWRSGALMGTTQEEAFFVKCDRTTMTQNDIDNGRLVVLVGIAPVKPAEFVIFRIAQVAKGSEVSE